jgi:hypothetical protein
MKVDALFVIICIVFVFAAWVATGGPSRPIATAGPFITPVTRPGEESQGYRYIVPANPIDTSSYPKQIAGKPATIASGPDPYQRDTSSVSGNAIYLEHSTVGPAASNPNQEYVTIVNRGNTDVDMRDWKIESTATHDSVYAGLHRFPSGHTLHIMSGREVANQGFFAQLCNQPLTDCAFLNRNLELWAKTRETITLYDQSGRAVDSFSY